MFLLSEDHVSNMEYSEFLGDVQHRLALDSQQAALRVTRVTLEILGERLGPGEAGDLAAQLPEEIGRHLEGSDEAESFGWDEFVDRVADRRDLSEDDRADAVYGSQVVMAVVAEAVTTGELADVVAQLPEELDALFEVADDANVPA